MVSVLVGILGIPTGITVILYTVRVGAAGAGGQI